MACDRDTRDTPDYTFPDDIEWALEAIRQLGSPPPPPCTRSTCAEDVFWTKAELESAVNEWIASPAAAEAKYGAIADWDTSGVDDLSYLFQSKTTFNAQLNWDTSKVTTMKGTFGKAATFNQKLVWDTSKVTNMYGMFYLAKTFNQPLGDWDVAKAMKAVFLNAELRSRRS